jgi:tetratricopeptide (TPR) repeat protein
MKKNEHLFPKNITLKLLLMALMLSVAYPFFAQNKKSSGTLPPKADSATLARKKTQDSLLAARKHFADSVAAIRAYRSSKRYTDSVARARKAKTDSVAASRKVYTDSVTASRQAIIKKQTDERKRVLDSTLAARKVYTDSVQTVRKHYTDSITAIRKYKESKKYQDSVAKVQKRRTDSITAARRAKMDSLIAARRQFTDSVTAVRQAYTDSVSNARKMVADSTKAARQKISDSITAIRSAKKDSLDKQKAAKEAIDKAKPTEEQKLRLKIAMKRKKEEAAWTNEKFLKKKWTIARRLYQNMVTRYNYYYNARRKMNEMNRKSVAAVKYNLDQFLPVYALSPEKTNEVNGPELDSVIKKASTGIFIHDPRNKWMDDLYLLIARAYYFKNDQDNALNALQYISKNYNIQPKKKKKPVRTKEIKIATPESTKLRFIKHQPVRNDALVWMIRTLTEMNMDGEAQALLTLIKDDKNFPKRLNAQRAAAEAFLAMQQNNAPGAIKPLQEAIAGGKSKRDKMRWEYLLGQIYQSEEQYAESSKHFRAALGYHPAVDMDFYSKLNIAQNSIQSKDPREKDKARQLLNSLVRNDRYTNYFGKAYYSLAMMSLADNKTEEGLELLEKSIRKNQSDNPTKAMAWAATGNIRYNQNEYPLAKIAYDSAVQYNDLSKPVPDFPTVATRQEVLSDVITQIDLIHNHDSLLHLASLPRKEQEQIARKAIARMEKAREDSLAKAADASRSLPNISNDGNPNSGQSWYFASLPNMQSGYNEFKRRWGSRPLGDNWRRMSSMNNFSSNPQDGYTADSGNPQGSGKEVTVDELLADLPMSDTAKQTKYSEIQDAYYELGSLYFLSLNNYPKAIDTYDTLQQRFPHNRHVAQVYYNLFLLYQKIGDTEHSNFYKNKLGTEFTASTYAQLAENPKLLEEQAQKKEAYLAFYDTTYRMFQNKQFNDVLARKQQADQFYRGTELQNRFDLLAAMSQAGLRNYDSARVQLQRLVANYAGSDVAEMASSVLKLLPTSGGVVSDSTIISQANQSTAKAGNFTYEPNAEHMYAFAFEKYDKRITALQAAFSDYNALRYSLDNLNTSISMLTADRGVLLVKPFKNAAAAANYMNAVLKTKELTREFKPQDFTMFVITQKNFNEMYKSMDYTDYLKFYGKSYK